MTTTPFNHFVDILYFLPRKIVFKNKEVFLKVLENEAQYYKSEKFLPEKNMARAVSKFFKDLSNNIKVTDEGLFTIEQQDAFKVLASASIMNEPSLIRKQKQKIAKRLIASCSCYTDVSVKKATKKSEQIIEAAKRIKGVDDQIFTYLCEYAKCWEEEENGQD